MSKNKSKIKGKKLSANQLQNEIFRLFRRSPKKQYNPKQISKKLKVANNRDSVQYALDQLAEAGKVVSLGDYKYKLSRADDNAGSSSPARSEKYLEGIVDMTRTGSAYIVSDKRENDVHVTPKYMNTALNGDRVRIRTWVPRGRKRAEGEVVEIIERATEHFIGILWRFDNYAIVKPDLNIPLDVFVPLRDAKNAADGEKVVVKVTKWDTGKGRNPQGVVTSVLGEPGSHDIEMKSILVNNGFQLDFTDEVMKEAEALPDAVTEMDMMQRLDLRGVTTFTIDPDTAKDFDDALSLRYLENGDCEIGIHIADVTHYLEPGTELDKEAYNRSTSVYLVDRVLPMLPEKLSNHLCSLVPNEDRLAFSAIFVFNKNDKIISRWFGKTIIHSNRRFTYEDAQQVIDKGAGEFAEELRTLNTLAGKLRSNRFKQGSIAFETDEVKFRLDENGAPVEVYVKERQDTHLLIEEYMLLANREVAAFISKKGRDNEIPFVYRIHDEPNPEKAEELAAFAREMGFEMDVSSPKAIGRSYNQLVRQAEKDNALKLLEPLAIRTMAKAEYSTDNIGHYGLGFQHYTHFTSPIRRYSDVLVHRYLLPNLLPGQVHRTEKSKLEDKCKHISMQERKAMTAERQSVKYKQVEFMESHVGETFYGYISGITDRGIFVQLKETLCEGMVAYEQMDEPYEPQGNLRIKGAYSGKEYKMGDVILVRILRTDLERRQIDMALVPEIETVEVYRANGEKQKPEGRNKRGRRK